MTRHWLQDKCRLLKPELASHVSDPAMCGVMGEPARGGATPEHWCAGPSSCWISRLCPSSSCELVWAVIVSVPGVFRTDPVGVDSVLGLSPVACGVCFGCHEAGVRRKKLSGRALRKRQATVTLVIWSPNWNVNVFELQMQR